MIIHNFDPVLIDFGLLQIRWYSVAYIVGIFLGWLYAIRIIKKTEKNEYNFEPVNKSDFDELIVYLVFAIILGGRIGYVIFYNFEYYTNNFLEIFKIWRGGMSFHGGLLGIIIAIFIFSKKKNVNFFKFADIIACVSPIGLFFGRIANFINGELYGKISTLPWAVIFPAAGNVTRHPSQIYEAILEGLILFVLINYLAFKKKFLFNTGYVSGLFLIFYAVFRIFSEIFREPDDHIGYFLNYFSMGTLLSFVTLAAGVLIIIYMKKNGQNN